MREELQTKLGNDFEKIKEQFMRFDQDNNGYIDAIEFSAMCTALGVDLTNTERDFAMKQIDKDHDGLIDVYEFTAWFNSRSKEYV